MPEDATVPDDVAQETVTAADPEPVAPVGETAPAAAATPAGIFGGQQAADEDDVPPRDAAERLTFATWAVITGKSAGGIFNTLPILDEDTAEKLAQRLTERVKAEVTVDDVLDCETIEQLADIVRRLQDSGADVGRFRPSTARAPGGLECPAGLRVPPVGR